MGCKWKYCKENQMKPLGQKPKQMNYEDCHPPKGFVNWWEKDCCVENKASARREWKQEAFEELNKESE